MHKHKCPRCNTVWEHTDLCVLFTEEIYQQSHTCPSCGQREVIDKYYGQNASEFIGRCLPSGHVLIPTLQRRIRL